MSKYWEEVHRKQAEEREKRRLGREIMRDATAAMLKQLMEEARNGKQVSGKVSEKQGTSERERAVHHGKSAPARPSRLQVELGEWLQEHLFTLVGGSVLVSVVTGDVGVFWVFIMIILLWWILGRLL